MSKAITKKPACLDNDCHDEAEHDDRLGAEPMIPETADDEATPPVSFNTHKSV